MTSVQINNLYGNNLNVSLADGAGRVKRKYIFEGKMKDYIVF